MGAFDAALLVGSDDVELTFVLDEPLAWSDFWLNPRRLRGSDFLMRWSQGRWSEDLLIQAVNETDTFFAIPYGPSGTAPDDPREFELYFERLDATGLATVKRPDLLIFSKDVRSSVESILKDLGGVAELAFIPDDAAPIKGILDAALLAIECENSLWIARKMPDFGEQLTPQKRLGGKLGVKKTAVLPTVIIKDEDIPRLVKWQETFSIPVHVWHAFYDMAFGLALDRATELIRTGLILPNKQTFQSPAGAVTRKQIYKFPYMYAYPLAESTEEPTLRGQYIEDKNGHVLPYVRFEGGRLRLLPEALTVLQQACKRR